MNLGATTLDGSEEPQNGFQDHNYFSPTFLQAFYVLGETPVKVRGAQGAGNGMISGIRPLRGSEPQS